MKALFVIALSLIMILTACTMPMPESVRLGDQALSTGNHIKAIEHYTKALSQATDDSIRKQIEQKLTQTKTELADEYLLKAADVKSRGSDRISALNQAIDTLNQVAQWDDKKNRIAAQLQIYKTEKEQLIKASINSLNQMSDQLAGYEFTDALQTIDNALAADPANKDLYSSKQTIIKLISYYESLQKQLAKGELQSAIESFNLMVKASPIELQFDKLPVKNEFVAAIQDQVKSLGRQNKWLAAHSLLTRWNLPELSELLADVRSRGSVSFYHRALKAEKKTHFHKAYLLAEKALLLDGKNLNIFNLHKRTRDLVNKSLQQYIAIASFDSPTNDPDAGMQFSDSLTSYLYNVLPYGINILERDKIDYVLKEKKENENNIGKVLGVDLIVTGRASLFQVETSEDRRTVKVKIKSGEQVVENPRFSQMFKLYGRNQELWPSIPPRTLKKETSEMVTYIKGTARLKGFAKVSVRIFDTAKATITFVRDYPASIEDVCEFHDEVPEAGIEFKPKKLVSKIEAKDAMRKEIVTEIGKVVQSSFNAREVRFLNQANFYLERRENELAFNPLAEGYLYCLQDNIKPDNKAFVKIQELIDLNIE